MAKRKNVYVLDEAGREAAAEVVAEWTAIAFKTGVMTLAEREEVKDAVADLYLAANLKPPPRHRIVIAPSPMVARFAAGAAAAIWYERTATYAATDAAINVIKTSNWFTNHLGCARAVAELAGNFGLKCAGAAWRLYQGGNMWVGVTALIAFGRDIARCHVAADIYRQYTPWERLARISGFRFVHTQFCIVADRPIKLTVDAANRPHAEHGPYIQWADGTAFYAWHGVRVPAHWLDDCANLDPREVIKAKNVEQRAAGAAIVGWPKMLSVLQSRVIDDSGNDDIGQLIELTLPGLNEPGRFLKAKCPRNGVIVEGVPHMSDIDGLPIDTALAAQAWRIGDPQSEYQHPARRT